MGQSDSLCAVDPVTTPTVSKSVPKLLFFQVMVLLASYLISALACVPLLPAIGTASARRIDREHIQALQRKAADKLRKNRLVVPFGDGDVRLNAGVKNFTFLNPAASGELSYARERCSWL